VSELFTTRPCSYSTKEITALLHLCKLPIKHNFLKRTFQAQQKRNPRQRQNAKKITFKEDEILTTQQNKGGNIKLLSNNSFNGLVSLYSFKLSAITTQSTPPPLHVTKR